MKALIDFDNAPVFTIAPRTGFATGCEGILIEGPQGWGEFSPPRGSSEPVAVRWLTSAIEGGTVGWPDPVRGRVPVSVAVPPVAASNAHAITADSGCRTADVRLTADLAEDAARLEAVRDALGPAGSIRCVAGGSWDVATAVTAIAVLDRAAGGLQYVEQPCTDPADLAAVRRRVDVRIAVEMATLTSTDVSRPEVSEAADVAVLSVGPLGGVRRALRVAESCGLPCVVRAAPQTSIGMAGGLALAGVLPDLPFACGLGAVAGLAGDVVSAARSLVAIEGQLPVAPMAPAPDPGQVGRFTPADPELVAWWRRRLQVTAQLL